MSSLDNPFSLPDDAYQRDFDIVNGYYEAGAQYLHLQTGRDYEECLAYVKKRAAPTHEQGMTNPRALVTEKNRHGDRELATSSFMKFLSRVKKENLLLSPSMAAYCPPSVKVSTHSQYIQEGTQKRKGVKKEMMAAELRGDHQTAKVKDGDQNNLKTNNNTYSGATASTATILFYKSTHSSLTSTCRTATSYANSANEKLLAGNRHYYTPEITKANLLSIINLADMDAVYRVCVKYDLHFPTPEEAWDCVRYSSEDLYWQSPVQVDHIKTILTNMTPAQRAAVVYVGDMYHLHQHNPEFVVRFLQTLSTQDTSDREVSDDTFDALDDDTQMLANFLCFKEVAGRGSNDLKENDPEVWALVKRTGIGVIERALTFRDLIQAFWINDCMPSSIHAFPSTYRRAAVVSDTDSTMFTMQYWIEQAFGYIAFGDEAKRMVFGICYIVTGMLSHILAKQSANMGVEADKLRLLAMKNEYYFAVLSMTPRSKHYYASQDAREGLVFNEPRLEVKGVGLRDSKVPPVINKNAKDLMLDIIQTIKSENPVSMKDVLHRVGDLEREIVASVRRGESTYLTTGQIKAKDSYKNGADTPAYQQYELWRDVFAPTFGDAGAPPYLVVKTSMVAGNRNEIEAWCEKMGDPALATRLKEWMAQRQKKDLNTLQIPYIIVETSGIPEGIVQGIDLRKIIANTMGVFYLMLESLGFFIQDKRNARLVSDYY